MLTERERQYQHDALALLMLGEGWKVLLAHIVEQIGRWESVINQPDSRESFRLHYLGAKAALVNVVHFVTTTAGQPNPFDEQRLAFLSSLALPPLPDVPTAPAPDESLRPRIRRPSGGIA